MSWNKDSYVIESHPFETFIPPYAEYLIVGTFPTFKDNFRFKFFYSGKDNLFWKIIESVFKHNFNYSEGEKAVEERKTFLIEKRIGITDMHVKCYRKNQFSTDESLFPIILNDVFSLLDKNSSIKRLVLTSRTDVFGALGLLKTYLLQNNLELVQLEKRKDKILQGNFKISNRVIEIMVPYSPSPRLIENGRTTLDELVSMYKLCLL